MSRNLLPALATYGRALRHGRIPGLGVMRAAAMLWVVRVALWCVPLSTLLAYLDSRRDVCAARRPPRQPGGLARVERRVRLGSRFVPLCTCFVQALVAELLLTELGYAPVVRLGAAKTMDNQFSAHAWVECEGRVVVGGDVSGFVEFRRREPRVTL